MSSQWSRSRASWSVNMFTALAGVHPRGHVVVVASPDPEPEREPSSRDDIDGRRLTSQQRGVVNRSDHDHRDQPDVPSNRRRTRQRNQRLPGVVGDAIDDAQAREPCSLRPTGPFDNVVTTPSRNAGWEADTDLHISRGYLGTVSAYGFRLAF